MKKSTKRHDSYAIPRQVTIMIGLLFVAVWAGVLLSNVSKKYQTATAMHGASQGERARLQKQLQNLEEQIIELESEEGRKMIEKDKFRVLGEGEEVLIFIEEEQG